MAAPVLTPQVASPRPRLNSVLTANPLSANSNTVGSLRYTGAEYPGSSNLHSHIRVLLLACSRGSLTVIRLGH